MPKALVMKDPPLLKDCISMKLCSNFAANNDPDEEANISACVAEQPTFEKAGRSAAVEVCQTSRDTDGSK